MKLILRETWMSGQFLMAVTILTDNISDERRGPTSKQADIAMERVNPLVELIQSKVQPFHLMQNPPKYLIIISDILSFSYVTVDYGNTAAVITAVLVR